MTVKPAQQTVTAHVSRTPNDRYMYGITVTAQDGQDVWWTEELGWEPADLDDLLAEGGWQRAGEWETTSYGVQASVVAEVA